MTTPRSPPDGVSIRVAARLTGITPETLRAWERRYGFPKPFRREGGSRLYAPEDIERLKLASRLLLMGYRPNEIVALPLQELRKRLANESDLAVDPKTLPAVSTDSALEALLADDVTGLRQQLRAAALSLGPKRFVIELAQPLLVRVGELWAEGELEVRHEHLASASLETQLRLLLGTYEDGGQRPVVVLTTLPDEPHVLGLEMVAVLLAAARASPRMLGRSMPVEQIVRAAAALDADVVGLTVSQVAHKGRAQSALRDLRERLPPGKEIWVGGSGAAGVVGRHAALGTVVESSNDLDRALERWVSSPPA